MQIRRSIFIRDPETYEWMWVNPMDVTKVIVNESKGKEPEQYVIRNLALNLQKKLLRELFLITINLHQ